MRATLPLILCAVLTTTGCSRLADSRINPLNWFGGSSQIAPTQTTTLAPLVPTNRGGTFDQRGGIADVASVRFDRTPEGGILRATGIASTQGQFNAQLVPVSQQSGVLTLAFRVEAAAGVTQSGPASTRQITVARSFSNADLTGVRTITVQGARNARSTTR